MLDSDSRLNTSPDVDAQYPCKRHVALPNQAYSEMAITGKVQGRTGINRSPWVRSAKWR